MTRSRLGRRSPWLASLAAIVLAAATGLFPATAAATEPADAVLAWNAHALAALFNAPTATPPGAGQAAQVGEIHLAMVQGAVYDAVNAIDGGHEAYLAGLPDAPSNASQSAAAATAAHHVLVGLTPALPGDVLTSLDALYAASLAAVPDGQAKADGIAIGAIAATAMLANRANDGRYVAHSFTAGTDAGEWRPELPSFASDPFAWAGYVRPFTSKSPSQFRTEGPYDLASPEYAADFNEVKALGGLVGSQRTDEQTDLARFVSANPLLYMNRGLREVAQGKGLSAAEAARLLAMAAMAGADALIGCWNDKDYWSFWRPITAIRHADEDGNPATTAQADWLPFLPTPPYTEHPSGYNCFTAATWHTARLYFGTDRVSFTLVSPASPNAREYTRFTDVIDDTIDGRIYTGFHFRNADLQGAWIGKKAAQYLDKHYFAPVD